MSAELLREAAKEIRERAQAATPGPWSHWHMPADGRLEVFVPNGTMDTETILEFKDHMDCEECIRPTEPDAYHITSWHPAVALAVADWLDFEAACTDRAARQFPSDQWDADERALNVARAYLGRPS